jgi:hypothetical protein
MPLNSNYICVIVKDINVKFYLKPIHGQFYTERETDRRTCKINGGKRNKNDLKATQKMNEHL